MKINIVGEMKGPGLDKQWMTVLNLFVLLQLSISTGKLMAQDDDY